MGTHKIRRALYVKGTGTITQAATMSSAATIAGTATLSGAANVSGALTGSTAVSVGKLQFGTITGTLSSDQTVTGAPGLLIVGSGATLTMPTPVAGDVWFVTNTSTTATILSRSSAGVTFNSPIKTGATTVTLDSLDSCILACSTATVFQVISHSSGVTST